MAGGTGRDMQDTQRTGGTKRHDDAPDLRAFVRSREAELERRLAEWVRIPGILGAPEHSQDLLRSANWLAGEFREVGFPVVEVLPTGESQAVYAGWCQAQIGRAHV